MSGLSDLHLPTVNALLNGTSAVLLTLGYLLIRRRQVVPHVVCMVGACVVSTFFLASYLYYHFVIRGGEPTRFEGPTWLRSTYLSILLSHTVLAIAVLPLVFVTLYRALRQQWSRHLRMARWTLPIWFYVSVTGVIIYLMLYQL